MKPITFSCEATLALAPEEIARQIFDLTKWPDFHGYGPIPEIKIAEFEVKTPSIVGTRIRVTNQDESSHVEEIVEWQPGLRIRLEMKEFSPPLSKLATGFEETWQFSRNENGTRVVRSFRLHAKTILGRLLLWFMSFFLKRAIARHLREMTSQPHVTEIELPICHNEGGRPGTEVLDVERVGPNRYRLVYSPGVVEGLAKGDEFELCSTDPKGFNVLKRSGHLCVWFFFKEAGVNRGPDGDRVRSAVEQFGGTCDGGGNTNLVFSVPVSLGFPAVEGLFNDLVKQYPGSSWLFGNVYDPWNDFKPFRWWE